MAVVINGTTGITSVNGSASAPSVTGTDTDTGIVYGTNTLSLATGGTTAVTVDSSQQVTFAQAANLPNTFGFKNRIINGGMQVWQRGTSGSGASTFVADRWYINANNTTSAQSSDVPTGFRFSNLMTGTSATNAQLTQKVESYNAGDLYGQAITVSFWAKSTSGSTQLGVYLSYATAQDNFTSTTSIGSTTLFTLTSSWAQYTVTFTTSAPSGVANGLQLGLFRSGTESSVTYITGVQLEKGSTATSFDFRSYGTELQLCQRYYEVGAQRMRIDPFPSGAAVGSVYFAATKRTTPTITGTATLGTLSTLGTNGENGAWFNFTAGASGNIANTWTASAEL